MIAMVIVPLLSYTWSTKYHGPALDSVSLGRMPGLFSKTRSTALYLISNHFEFSLQFDLFILFCFFRVISAQSVLHCIIGKIVFLQNTSCADKAPRVVCTVLLIENAVADKIHSMGVFH